MALAAALKRHHKKALVSIICFLCLAFHPSLCPSACLSQYTAVLSSSSYPNIIQVVTWVCDPVHGNTESVNGFKTRRYDNIRAEVEAFFDVHDQMGSVPGGVHLEMTGKE